MGIKRALGIQRAAPLGVTFCELARLKRKLLPPKHLWGSQVGKDTEEGLASPFLPAKQPQQHQYSQELRPIADKSSALQAESYLLCWAGLAATLPKTSSRASRPRIKSQQYRA